MKKSMRGLVLLDLIVFAGAWWMVAQTQSGAWNSTDPTTSIDMIMTTAGFIIGAVTAVLLVAFLLHRRAGN